MSDGSLSQEEIDALLQGTDDFGATVEPGAPVKGLADDEKTELGTLASELAQTMSMTLSTITAKTVEISNPQIQVVNRSDFLSALKGKNVQLSADYTEGLKGSHSYVISEQVARQVAALMMAQEEGDLTDMALSALTEGFSQLSGGALSVITERSGTSVRTEALGAQIKEKPEEIETPQGEFVRVRYDFKGDGKSSNIHEILDMNAAKSLAQGLLMKKGMGLQQTGSTPQQGESSFQPGIQNAQVYSTDASHSGGPGNVGVQPVQFSPLSPARDTGITGNIGLLMDVSMQLTVELGRTKMLIKDILGMGEGTIVELDKLVGEPVDLLVNGKLIAKGEVVVIDENFGVRVTDIISPMERISSLE